VNPAFARFLPFARLRRSDAAGARQDRTSGGRRRGRRASWRSGLILALALACVAAADAQRRGRYREGSFAPRYAPEKMPDSDFTVCRLEYTRVVVEDMGVGWQTDYPFSERNLMTRLSELTKTRISRDSRNEPNTWVVRATDPQLFNCPYVVASDAGTIGLKPEEVFGLRNYLLKGGFLWVDDFWGTAAWEQWSGEIGRVLPATEFPIKDVPLDDPLLRTLFPVTAIPQITNIQFWRSFQGRVTSERGADSEDAHLRAIRDQHGRIMVLMTHNTDVADSWEREGDDPGVLFQFSPPGSALGVDVLLHAMPH
jgi:hypothetical protein